MPTTKCSVVIAIGLLCGQIWCSNSTLGGETVTAILRDGRSVFGVVDTRTDADYLWLRRTSGGFDLVSGFAWNDVLEGRTASGQLDRSTFRDWASGKKQPGRLFAEIEPTATVDHQPASAQLLPEPSASFKAPRPDTLPLKTLIVQAELAQWDKDVQPDGLRIFVSPLDARGRIVPVDGRIEFTLVIQTEQLDGRLSPLQKPEFLEGDRISYIVKRDHFSSGPGFYELPFDKWHPDFDPNIAFEGLLYARLSVPGKGVFEASDARVCLRELSRFRDQLQYFTPGRYWPLESSGQRSR